MRLLNRADKYTMEKLDMSQALVANRKYQGKYVAFDDSHDNKIVAYGQNAGVVIEKARQRGVNVPSVVFVPKEDTAYVY